MTVDDADARMRDRLTKHAEIRGETDSRETHCNWKKCGKPLRRDNMIGRCKEHRIYRVRRKCKCIGCKAEINANNASGYCPVHKYKTKRCRDAAIAIIKGHNE